MVESKSEQRESLGRIEVAPEVLVTIAQNAVLRIEGVSRMAAIPADMARMLRRAPRQNGIVLDLTNNQVRFNIYVIMEPHVNIVQISRSIQKAIVEAIDTLVGIPVDAVNVHVEDVLYERGEAV
jgi:uncharacterized alkaline shock family protein YloU